MMRDGDRIDHMLSFTRRCIEILDGVDISQFLSSVEKQESLELNFLHLGEAAARVSEEVKLALQASGKFIPCQIVTIALDGRIIDS